MGNDRPIECRKHGFRPVRFVCMHVAEAADTENRVGFFWAEQEGDLPPIAWCAACESWLRRPGASWNEEFTAMAHFVPFCADCYEFTKRKLYGG